MGPQCCEYTKTHQSCIFKGELTQILSQWECYGKQTGEAAKLSLSLHGFPFYRFSYPQSTSVQKYYMENSGSKQLMLFLSCLGHDPLPWAGIWCCTLSVVSGIHWKSWKVIPELMRDYWTTCVRLFLNNCSQNLACSSLLIMYIFYCFNYAVPHDKNTVCATQVSIPHVFRIMPRHLTHICKSKQKYLWKSGIWKSLK